MTPIFLAKVEHNRLKLENTEQFSLWCGQFEGKDVQIIVKKKTRKRTSGQVDELGNQNGYYWSVVLPLSAKTLGYTDKEMHEVFMTEYAPYHIVEFKNKKITVKIRTSEMDTIQFTEYVKTIRQVMAEMNCIIPDPNKIK